MNNNNSDTDNKKQGKIKTFSQWTIEEVEDTFQLNQLEESHILTSWLRPEKELPQKQEQELDILRHRLLKNVYGWNEEELKMRFISPLLELADYNHEQFKPFFERELSVMADNRKLYGIVDMVLAQGKYSPKRPFFCLHEYKRERHSSNDPLGQLVISMIAVQYMNNDREPVYGAYVIGRLWYFTILEDNSFAVSLAYDATTEKLSEIMTALTKIKKIIEKRLRQVI